MEDEPRRVAEKEAAIRRAKSPHINSLGNVREFKRGAQEISSLPS
jgi:hypothetical protein